MNRPAEIYDQYKRKREPERTVFAKRCFPGSKDAGQNDYQNYDRQQSDRFL